VSRLLSIPEISAKVKVGEKIFGLKLNHSSILGEPGIKEVFCRHESDQVVKMCSVLDLRLVYFHLSGKDLGTQDKYDLCRLIKGWFNRKPVSSNAQ
jgi:hypothetical protein